MTRNALTLARSRRSKPILIGSTIAAAGLVLSGFTAAFASGSSAPKHGDAIGNVTTLENSIKAYYGSTPGSYPGIGAVTLPSPTGNYAKEVKGIESQAKGSLIYGLAHHGTAKPALVFDIDDTLLNTYDYEISSQFGYTPTSNAAFVNAEAFPAVFGMPTLVNWAASEGYTVFFITGRPESQRDATAGNLVADGYTAPADTDHLFLKPPAPVSYLPCSSTHCTTFSTNPVPAPTSKTSATRSSPISVTSSATSRVGTQAFRSRFRIRCTTCRNTSHADGPSPTVA